MHVMTPHDMKEMMKEMMKKIVRRNEWKKYALQGEYVKAIRSLRAYGGVKEFQSAKSMVEKFMTDNGVQAKKW